MGVALLEGLDLGLNAHHLQRRLHHHEAGGQHHQVEDDGDDDDGPAPVVDPGAKLVAQEAQGQVERLGDDGKPAKLDERIEGLAGGLAVRADGMDGVEHVHLFGPGVKAQAGRSAGVAHRDSQHIVGPLLAARIAQHAGDFQGVVQRHYSGALRSVGQERGREVQIDDPCVLVRQIQSGVAAHLLRCDGVGLAFQGPGKLAGSGYLRPGQRRGKELFHVTQAGRPGHQRSHRSAVALHL